MELLGPDRELLASLARDLHGALALVDDTNDVARLYGQGGAGARDPPTKAVVTRYRDVMRGKLDPLLEAWRRERAGLPTGRLE